MFGLLRFIAGKVALVAKGFSPRRSSKWPKLRANWLKVHPGCEYCNRVAVEVHHKIPFHFRPEWECDLSNLQSVCRRCHLHLAHCGNWKLWNDHCDEIAKLFRDGIRGRLDDGHTMPPQPKMFG